MVSQKKALKKSVKVVMLGDTGVGKSSVALRFATNEFRPYSESTIGASFMSKTIELQSESESTDDKIINQLQKVKPLQQSITFNIWDTAGQEKYHSLAPMYYRSASCAILVYDICNQVTFTTLQKWVDELRQKGPSEILLAVCGNKCDLNGHRQVEEKAAKEYAENIGAFYIETSARDNTNIQQLFEEVGKRVPSLGEEDYALGNSDSGAIDLAVVNENTKRNFWSTWC